jgi:hypothetical protein
VDAALWGLLGVVVGGFIAGYWAIRAAKQAARLDHWKRLDDRKLARDTDQRATLIGLQEAVNELVRQGLVMYLHDLEAFRGGAAWGVVRQDTDAPERERLARQRVALLRSRTDDELIRTWSKDLSGFMGELFLAADKDEGERARNEVLTVGGQIVERAGELIRATYDGTLELPD